jgi:hypothetical protein
MKVLRDVNGFQLNKGSMMAEGLFNISKDDKITFWMDAETAEEMINMTDEEFISDSIELLKHAENV